MWGSGTLLAEGIVDSPDQCPTQYDEESAQILSYTSIQHNYPSNPLPQACRISSFFDAVRGAKAHHAEDLVFDNGAGGGTVPAYGTVVAAMEEGDVVAAVSGNGPSSVPYDGTPSCKTLVPSAPGNYVKIKAKSDLYFTIYFHVTPSVSKGQHVLAGATIGVLDNSGCQSHAHLHIGRKDTSGTPVNFTIPCVNPLPFNSFFDGLVDDDVPDDI